MHARAQFRQIRIFFPAVGIFDDRSNAPSHAAGVVANLRSKPQPGQPGTHIGTSTSGMASPHAGEGLMATVALSPVVPVLLLSRQEPKTMANRRDETNDVADQLPQYLPALRRYARALTGDVTAADDLVQDCAERALSRAHLWHRPGNMRAWLFTIMHNLNANNRRRAATRPRLAAVDDVPEPSWPAGQLERLEANQTLAAIRQLSADHREVLMLVAIEGMAYTEAANVLGVPPGTVMSRLSRARDHLRQLTGAGPTRHAGRTSAA
jgi:RNA polymerase sigma-70 factor (ECF subfamily)